VYCGSAEWAALYEMMEVLFEDGVTQIHGIDN
jgi:hypothetical protein